MRDIGGPLASLRSGDRDFLDRCARDDHRVHAARELAGETGVDLLVVTPGSDLRYLAGYNAHAMERLTALAVPRQGEPFLVAPRLEAPMVDASPAGGLGLEVLAWDETDDPFALLAGAATARLGSAPARVGVGARTWAEHALGVQRALPGSALELASPVWTGCGWSSRRRRSRSSLWPGRPSTGCTPGWGSGRGRPDRGRGGRRHRRGDPRGGPRRGRLHDRRLRAERRQPAPRAVGAAIEAGDLVVVDIGGETATGYRSDCTRTYVVGGSAQRGGDRVVRRPPGRSGGRHRGRPARA